MKNADFSYSAQMWKTMSPKTLKCAKLWETLWKLCKTHQNQASFGNCNISPCGKLIENLVMSFVKESVFFAFCTKKKQKVNSPNIFRCMKITFQRRNGQKYPKRYPPSQLFRQFPQEKTLHIPYQFRKGQL